MNDFSREELQDLIDWANYAAGNPHGPTTDSITPLYNKIKSMLDNYCEHEWRESAINAIYCTYCQKHMEYEE